ncbi:hypothetical protein EST38_g8391 [Candolleomyces aberdarensis]|uniref:Uncharacterized protein n=1 Tax=Candolleomyces aberdarensis TaxID=2316362 RepID=A0A4Q2DFI4_9AGAR|nr:hypothetical protein EST38_g8391 [Candolleomyces aberdarensis]
MAEPRKRVTTVQLLPGSTRTSLQNAELSVAGRDIVYIFNAPSSGEPSSFSIAGLERMCARIFQPVLDYFRSPENQGALSHPSRATVAVNSGAMREAHYPMENAGSQRSLQENTSLNDVAEENHRGDSPQDDDSEPSQDDYHWHVGYLAGGPNHVTRKIFNLWDDEFIVRDQLPSKETTVHRGHFAEGHTIANGTSSKVERSADGRVIASSQAISVVNGVAFLTLKHEAQSQNTIAVPVIAENAPSASPLDDTDHALGLQQPNKTPAYRMACLVPVHVIHIDSDRLVTATCESIQNLDVYQKQCENMVAQCMELIHSAQEGAQGREDPKAAALTQHLKPFIERINEKVAEWVDWGPLKRLLQRSEIKDGVNLLQRQLDDAIFHFGGSMNLELQRSPHDSKASNSTDSTEIREALQAVMDSRVEIKTLLAIQSPQPVEQVMRHLQEELRDPNMPTKQKQSFRSGLWALYNKTSKLPPLTDLTGQVELNSRNPEFIGSSNDIYTGTWLDKEMVALRFPKTSSHSMIVRKDLQQEVSMWRNFDHPNVLPLYGVVYIRQHLYSVAPWMTNGTAINLVQKRPQTNVLKMLSEIAEGLAYLHSKGIFHGDLQGVPVDRLKRVRRSLTPTSEEDLPHPSSPRLIIMMPIASLDRISRLPLTRRWQAVDSLNATAQSILAVDSANQEFLLQKAISDRNHLVYTNYSGTVVAGTLNGLVNRLVDNFDLSKDEEYHEVILTACVDFITPEDLFAMLQTRFEEAEEDTHNNPTNRLATQYNVFMVISYWLIRHQLPVNSRLLWQMRTFCENAIRMKRSSPMVQKARHLLQLIDTQPKRDVISRTSLAPGGRRLSANEITPRCLAIALTLLEGDRYRQITPCDFLVKFDRLGYNNVDAACSANKKIILWIKRSLLHYDSRQSRAAALTFFIQTANECRKLRNYHSLIAIAIALDSAPVQSLDLTREPLSSNMVAQLEALVRLPHPEGNYSRYREVLAELIDPAYRDYCIPWISLHSEELHSVLHLNARVVEIQRRPLINFQRFTKFVDRFKEIFLLPPPDLERYRQQGQLAYLEAELADVGLDERETFEGLNP